MSREINNTEFTIGLRSWNYGRFLSQSFSEHLKSWCFSKWNKSNACDVWEDTGIRLFGIEFNWRKYLPLKTSSLTNNPERQVLER